MRKKMTDKAIGVHLEDWHIVQGVRTGNSPWSPIAIAQVPVKEPAPSAPVIESVTAPEASAGVLEIKVSLPETNADGTALARAELVRLRLHHSTSPGVTESDPYVDFPPSETLLWAPNDTVTHYVRARVQDSHGLWSELSNEASGQAKASLPQEDSGLWAHRLGVESIFTNDSPEPGYVSWSNVVLYWKDNKYEIEDGSTDKKYIWWDYSTSTTTFQTSDTRPELDLEDVIIGYNDNGTWRLMCYQPTVMADYVRAGVLQSSNWGATTGSQLDLDNGTLKLGGSDSPKFQVDADGVLHATGAVISGNVTITGGTGVANLSDAGALATLDVVGTAQIEDLAVTTAKIADAAITNAKIADATITDAKIASLSADKITTGTLDASQVNVINLNASNITTGKLNGYFIETNSILADRLNVSQLSAISADLGTITAGSVTSVLFRTAASGQRAEINPGGSFAHSFVCWDSSGTLRAAMREDSFQIIDPWSNTAVRVSFREEASAYHGHIRLYGRYSFIEPNSSGFGYVGTADYYFNTINAKYFTDRGCLGDFSHGVELRDGRIVSDVEALKAIKAHPEKKTEYGTPMLDYSTLPKAVYRPAGRGKVRRTEKATPSGFKVSEETIEEEGAEGAELTALISIMIGAIKELDERLSALERESPVSSN